MRTDTLQMVVKGPSDLARLRRLGYVYNPEGSVWFMDGAMHRYSFRYGMGDEVVVTVKPKPFGVSVPTHRFTLDKACKHVIRSIDVIQAKEG